MIIKGLAIGLCMFSIACSDSDPKSSSGSSITIRSGSSFGECIGYCWTEMEITQDGMNLVRKGNDPVYPDQTFSKDIDSELWNSVESLIDFDTLQSMDDVYGCPDCADGGAEWIEVTMGSKTKKVTFEYGHNLEEISDLIELVRALRESFVEEVVE